VADNHRVRAVLAEFLETTPNSVLATTPTALNRDIVGQDLSPYFRIGNRDQVFYFAGDLPYSFDVQRYLFDLISEQNAIVREQSRLNRESSILPPCSIPKGLPISRGFF
jgi:hypothetical protein